MNFMLWKRKKIDKNDNNIVRFLYNNIELIFHYIQNDHISNFWKNKIFYEHNLLLKIKSFNLNGTYIDLGAHHGNHSIYFYKFCNSDKVISIEGNPFNFNYLKKNIGLNNCNNILYNIIIDKESNKQLYMEYNTQNTGSSYIINDNMLSIKYNKNIIKNKTIRLDDLLKNENNINLIKIDIENYEYNALLGAINIIEKHKPIIVIELHKINPYYNEIIDFFKERNYETDNINYACSPTFIYTKRV